MLALYPDQVSHGHAVLAFRAKVKPDGTHDVKKARVTIADKADAAAPCQYYAGCANPVAVRLATQLRLQMPEGVQTTVDVSAAYFHGEPTPPEEGGRIIYAKVCKWLALYFGYATHDHMGRRNILRIVGNVPGRRDAGRIWACRNDRFLTGYGLVATAYDPRCFVKCSPQSSLRSSPCRRYARYRFLPRTV